VTTTVDDLVPKTFYIPGLSFRGQIADGTMSIIAHDANGAVQLAWSCGDDDPAPAAGLVTVHSPLPRVAPGVAFVGNCVVLGGKCYAAASKAGYTNEFRPVLATGDMRLVCVLLAQWHDEVFAAGQVWP